MKREKLRLLSLLLCLSLPLTACGASTSGSGKIPGGANAEAAQSNVSTADTDSAKHEYSDEAGEKENAFPQAVSGTWSSAAGADGSAEYTLDIQQGSETVECTFYENVPDENIHVSYTGWLELVSAEKTGLVCGYTLTGPDGNDPVGTMALLPQDDTMLVQPVSGNTLFDADDGLQFVRSVG